MREKFEDRRLTGVINVACKYDDGTVRYWNVKKETVVSQIIHIVNEYTQIGERLTLRQLHYQLVTKNWIVNHDTAYKKLGGILDDCRYAGIIDWNAIEDRGRKPFIQYSVDDIPDAMQDTIDQYKLDRQRGQENYVELWTEKDALSGILSKSTNKYHIQLVVNKGYTSSSAAHVAYQRSIKAIENNQKVTILYFGDHDPSGLDMIRDIRERLLFFLSRGKFMYNNEDVIEWWQKEKLDIYNASEFSGKDFSKLIYEEDDKLVEGFEYARIGMYIERNNLFKVIPIGLTIAQIKKYSLPANPTKMTDSRAENYVRQFGKTCWEVDALKPEVLRQIVETNIEKVIDMKMYTEVCGQEKKDVVELEKLLSQILKKKKKK